MVRGRSRMNDLLDRVLDVHGGLADWKEVTAVTAHLSLGGAFWGWKGWPEVYAHQTVKLDTRREHITFEPFTHRDRVSVLDVSPGLPEQVEIRTTGGRVIETRDNPRASFPAYGNDTPWDAVQVAYFTSAAMWNHLTAPFVFTYPGVGTREIEPWDEDGQRWRRLAVRFPPSIAGHNREQVFYYDAGYHQRRIDYRPEVTGSPIAHYTYEPRTFDGFLFYRLQLVHLRGADNVADKEFAPITIDIHSVELTRAY